jgi:hypothetical protein
MLGSCCVGAQLTATEEELLRGVSYVNVTFVLLALDNTESPAINRVCSVRHFVARALTHGNL